MLLTGCGGSSEQQQTGQNAVAPLPAQPAAAPAQPKRNEGKGNSKLKERLDAAKAAKGAEKPKTAAAKKEALNKPVGEWGVEELKSAVTNKDPRYVEAVMMHGMKSRGSPQAGGELSQLLASVATMPAEAVAPGPNTAIAGAKRKKSSNRGGDDDDQPAAATPPTAAAAAAPGAAPPAAAAPAAPVTLPKGKIGFGRGASER
jgi:hypothetical protein